MTGGDLIIGLEIHVQLATRTKLFCADRAVYGAEPNTNVCPVCLGLPGGLPVLNEAAVALAVRAALGLGCAVHPESEFARKNYFYPDLPKGYQITQHDRPLATGGRIGPAGSDDEVRIRRVHLEEDAGKSLHDRLPGRTAVDLNRAGVPLVEIVTEPDLRSPAAARAFLTRLKRILEYLDVSDCDMEKGSLRVDANLSIGGADGRPGVPCEIKNLNSFTQLERALELEADRQREILGRGDSVRRETLLYDSASDRVRRIRGKEDAAEYRYFPEPDLPPLTLSPEQIGEIRRSLPEMPDARAGRLVREHGIPEYDAGVLTASRSLADYYEAAVGTAGDAKAAGNLLMTEVLAWVKERQEGIEAFPIAPERFGRLVALSRDGTLSSTLVRTVLARMLETGRDADEIVRAEGLSQVGNPERIAAWAAEVLDAHPDEVRRYREGEKGLLGFFMGRLMERSGGKADPRKASSLLRERLEGDGG